MNGNDATAKVIEAFEQLKLPYMLVGSFSTNAYGISRSTKDADFVVQFVNTSIHDLVALLPSEFQLDPQIAFESVTGTTRYILDIEEIPFQIELFKLSDDPHDQQRFQRRLQGHSSQLQRNAYFPTAEDVIITKLRWAAGAGRDKDRDDIRNVLAVQDKHLDFDYINDWCDQHDTRTLLEEIRDSLPPLDDLE